MHLVLAVESQFRQIFANLKGADCLQQPSANQNTFTPRLNSSGVTTFGLDSRGIHRFRFFTCFTVSVAARHLQGQTSAPSLRQPRGFRSSGFGLSQQSFSALGLLRQPGARAIDAKATTSTASGKARFNMQVQLGLHGGQTNATIAFESL